MENPSLSASPYLFQEELYRIPPRVLIVIAEEWDALSENDLTVLTKLLGALKLSLASVQVITRPSFAMRDIAAFNPARVLVFGAQLQQAPPLYENASVDNTPVIVSESLAQLDDPKKKKLWLALRQMFGI